MRSEAGWEIGDTAAVRLGDWIWRFARILKVGRALVKAAGSTLLLQLPPSNSQFSTLNVQLSTSNSQRPILNASALGRSGNSETNF